MRMPGSLRAIPALALIVVSGLLALPGVALGGHGPTVEQVVSVATSETRSMTCESGLGSVECAAADFDFTWSEHASIRPGSGSLTDLDTQATVFAAPLDTYFQGWHAALQGVACAPDRISASQLTAFIADVASRRTAGDAAPITIAGECSLAGGLRVLTGDSGTQYTYWIRSVVQATSTPAPTASPTLTPRPTATPSSTSSPSPRLTSTAPSASPSGANGSSAPSPTSPGTPAPAPSDTASAASSATTSPTPEQQVAGGNPTPQPAASDAVAPGDPAAPGGSGITVGALVRSVATPGEASGDIAGVGRSALLAILLLLFVAFAAELFNSTLEGNYDEVAGWFAILRRGGGRSRLARLGAGRTGLALFLGAGALVYALLDPRFGFDLGTLASYLGLLVGLVLVLVAFEAPGVVLYRRRTGETPGVRALPWTLPAAVVCVLLSRVADLQPGYLYGILLGVVFRRELTAGEEGRQAAAGALWTLAVALAAWLGLGWLRSGGAALDPFALVVVETALATAVVGGLEAVALGLVPMRFLAGSAVYAWSRVAWAVLFGAGAFAFVHVLIGPQTGYLSQLTPGALVAACGAFAAFGAFSVAFWSYFRFRPARTSA